MSDGHSFKKHTVTVENAKNILKSYRAHRKYLEGKAKDFGRVVKRQYHYLNQGPNTFVVTGDNWEMFDPQFQNNGDDVDEIQDEIMHDVTERIKKTTERAATVAKAEPDSPVP